MKRALSRGPGQTRRSAPMLNRPILGLLRLMTTSGQTQLKETTGAPLKAEPLYGRAMSAISWRFLSESSKFILQLTVIVILARLIHVDQFGLLALAMVVMNLVIEISEIGVNIA